MIRYLFKGRMHEVVVEDMQGLKAPKRHHMLGSCISFDRHVSELVVLVVPRVRPTDAIQKREGCS